MREWTFLTNHAAVLLALAEQSDVRVERLAQELGLTERSVRRIVDDLVEAGYVVKRREGRRNRYTVRAQQRLRHPLVRHRSVGALLALLEPAPAPRKH